MRENTVAAGYLLSITACWVLPDGLLQDSILSAATFSLAKVSLVFPGSGQKPPTYALRDISLQIQPNDFIGIIGPNGAGKSSLLQLLNGRYPPTAGAVLLSGRPIARLTATQLAKRVATVAQLSPPPFGLSCLQVAAMCLLPHKRWFEQDTDADRHQVQLALQQVGLLHKQHDATATLSGGELQRLNIARALVQQAAILLLDEPTNHLDVQYQHQVLQLLQQLNKTVICCLHDLNLAARYCNKLLLLQQGQPLAFGPPDEVLQPKLLHHAFALECDVRRQPAHHWLQVTFFPPPPLSVSPLVHGGECK